MSYDQDNNLFWSFENINDEDTPKKAAGSLYVWGVSLQLFLNWFSDEVASSIKEF